jgi:hypothetical protein
MHGQIPHTYSARTFHCRLNRDWLHGGYGEALNRRGKASSGNPLCVAHRGWVTACLANDLNAFTLRSFSGKGWSP